jgi:hypothetical protein
MKPIELNPDIEWVAERVMWFEEPDKATSDMARFVAYVMTYGDHADMNRIRQHLTDDELREAIDSAPPGIFDPRSWTYWNLKLGRYPAPPMPERFFHSIQMRR